MKARVRATREIVDVLPYAEEDGTVRFYANMEDKWHEAYEIDIVSEVTPPDYWTRLEHQYAGMAMQGMLANSAFDEVSVADIAITSIKVATSVIKRLKEERK